jgi:hypothetical protein
VSLPDINPQEELKRLDEQIRSATELDALRPLFYRLSEILQAFPGDFDVQFTGNDLKQRLFDRGKLLQQNTAAGTPPAPETPAVFGPPEPPEQVAAEGPFPQPLFDFGAAPPAPPVLPPAEPVLPPPIPAAPPTIPSPASAMPTTRPTLPSSPSARPPRRSMRIVAIVAAAGVLAAVALALAIATQFRQRGMKKAAPAAAAVQVALTTTPAGASVHVVPDSAGAGGKETSCTANCQLALMPGNYRVSASLEGFESAASVLTVKAPQTAALNLILKPLPTSLRLLTDLERGQVVVDDAAPAELTDGQWSLDAVGAGTHTVKVTGPDVSAWFTLEVADARMPAVTGPVKARNLMAVLIASLGTQARLTTSGGPWKLTVNGQAQSDADPKGTDLVGFRTGLDEISIGDGPNSRTLSESFEAAPRLTAFLKTDVNAGTLIVSTGEDDVRVYLNGKEYRRRTKGGQVRIQTLGKVTVRVAKSGFQEEPPQTADVGKGAEVRLKFGLRAEPRFGALEIRGAAAGTEVAIDQKPAGIVGGDGTLSVKAVQPGERTVELRREQYQTRRVHRSFQAGQTVVLSGADVVLTAANGTVRFTREPAAATVSYRREDETEWHAISGNQVELPAGNYVFSASAPGYNDSGGRVAVAGGENKELHFALVERKVAPPPVKTSGMAEFEDAATWRKQGDTWFRTGGGFVAYKLPPKGIFTFKVGLVKGGGVFHAGAIRWCVQYLDARNYLLYELDRKNFWAGVVEKGQRLERVKTAHNLGEQKTYTVQVEVAPDRLVQRIKVGDNWKVFDTFTEPGRDFTKGKFGFLIQGSDEIAVSDFSFLPK